MSKYIRRTRSGYYMPIVRINPCMCLWKVNKQQRKINKTTEKEFKDQLKMKADPGDQR